MTRAGEEMVLELAALLGSDIVKNAAKKEEDKGAPLQEKKGLSGYDGPARRFPICLVGW